MKIKVDTQSKRAKVPVQIIKSRPAGHRVSIGHSMFIDAKHFNKLMELAGR